MKFALHFGNLVFPDAAGAARLGRAAEAAGFDSVLAVDHVVLPEGFATRYPYSADGNLPAKVDGDWPDPLVWLAFLAAATTKLKLLTGVVIVPQREPVVMAKQIATLDMMSGGRFEFGIGVGWLKEEFEALGMAFERRGKRTDEYLAAMRALWSPGPTEFSGEFIRFPNLHCYPKPAGKVPIIVGGHSEAAAKRAGRLGDGFFPSIGSQFDVFPLFDIVRAAAEKAGRDPAGIEFITGCPDALPASGKDPVAAVEERRARGVSRIVLPLTAFMPDLEANLARFGEQVIRPCSR
ncbi:LLM class F420-dependent oxidoreductase [Siccirubricoccus sp. KC 17139]|uniref:LLM class F420-dependent oxidoreductase n=1 Tax=Siccirubricoccus soli TaxID=2899147 RepID=A0ABT1D7F8_9PROT|nr:LLM class F420-dependent oxidoreductase [Siccirubricoccus soli]MCP2684010.1 LLM class F420-dependent oxidoreductase [Siccirubricoccus soli]